MAIKLKLTCSVDQTEWEIDLTPEKEEKLWGHSLFLANANDKKGAEMPEMKCPACGKNDGHTATRTFTEE